MSFIHDKFFKKIQNINTVMYNQQISIETIKGVVIGPHSISFKQYMRMQVTNEDIQTKKFD